MFFHVEFGGAAPGTGHDQVLANGNVNLGGATLTASILSGFNPATGTSFTILQSVGGTITGLFQNVPGGGAVTAARGNTYAVDYSDPTRVVLSALNDIALANNDAFITDENTVLSVGATSSPTTVRTPTLISKAMPSP